MPLHRSFLSTIDSIEPEEDRLNLRFVDKPGSFWVAASGDELVGVLRRALQSGGVVEVTFAVGSGEVVDVLAGRAPPTAPAV
jgi:hypothetical protein